MSSYHYIRQNRCEAVPRFLSEQSEAATREEQGRGSSASAGYKARHRAFSSESAGLILLTMFAVWERWLGGVAERELSGVNAILEL